MRENLYQGKVIAINDAPMIDQVSTRCGPWANGLPLMRAYYKGDIFYYREYTSNIKRHHKWFTGMIIIWHNKLGMEMEVEPNNFISLEEFRNNKIDQIIK